ncbi:MAG: hypothetical protein HYX77_06435 [Acidobacteria bacterium]|nr:hypothetical protein [Acidobacteriota bacterium]
MFILLLASAVFLLAERSAHAYVDPGTGSLLYQAALTLLLGFGLAVRRIRGSVAGLVRRLASRGTASERITTERD